MTSLGYHSIVYIHASSHCGRVSSVVLSPEEGGILSSSEFLWTMAMRGDGPKPLSRKVVGLDLTVRTDRPAAFRDSTKN